MKSFLLVLIFFICSFKISSAQNSEVEFRFSSNGSPVPFVHIKNLKNNQIQFADSNGIYRASFKLNEKITLEFSSIGFISQDYSILINSNTKVLNIELKPDVFGLDQVIVSAGRNEIKLSQTPIKIDLINPENLQSVNARSVGDLLGFSPGLRVENNCQTCGFSSIRINGLDGRYSQVLIDSRYLYSALIGVYGLDQIPASIIDRVEVSKGAGSVLYGANAIAGTINIITKEPQKTGFEIAPNINLINFKGLDSRLPFRISIKPDSSKWALDIYGMQSNRENIDLNNDSISDITRLSSLFLGTKFNYLINKQSLIKLSINFVNENRRGGNKFEYLPHQSDLTEQLKHEIFNSQISYKYYSKDFSKDISIYSAIQKTKRDSYYGSGGRVLGENDTMNYQDSLALGAYGYSEDWVIQSGIQFNWKINYKHTFLVGTEWYQNRVSDQFVFYQKLLNQNVSTLGFFTQWQWNISPKINTLAGLRFDQNWIYSNNKLYDSTIIQNINLPAIVPRIAINYKWNNNIKSRLSYAMGYRGPQAFDEDLHIQNIGGTPRFILISNNLKAENSQSLNFNTEYLINKRYWAFLNTFSMFFTQINNSFIYREARDFGDVSFLQKTNGGASQVYGIDLQNQGNYLEKFKYSISLTLQRALFINPEVLWSPDEKAIEEGFSGSELISNQILRTPNIYGFAAVEYKINKKISSEISALYTGSMLTPKVSGPQIYANSESAALQQYTELFKTPDFLDLGFKVNYNFSYKNKFGIDTYIGIRNILNSFQKDLPQGINRDSNFIYGPLMPRSIYFGVKFSNI